jgi:septal ring factor EnvC (AmiA/AmiB activator)
MQHAAERYPLTIEEERDVERYVRDLEKNNERLRKEVVENEKLIRTTDRAVELLKEEVARRDNGLRALRDTLTRYEKQFELDSQRIAALERELEGREGKAEAEVRKLRELLGTIRHDRDKLLELVRWWQAEVMPLRFADDDLGELYLERERQLIGRNDG